MKWSQMTDTGLVRAANEDSMCACPDIGLFAVADGMGGHKAGEIASSESLKTIEESLRELLKQAVGKSEALLKALEAANQKIYQLSSQFPNYRGMGTTVTAGLLDGTEFIIAHIGDSRAYLLHQDNIKQLTDDHSLVGEMLRVGGITEEQALTHPQRNVLTRALGTAPDVIIDIYHVTLVPGDKILLCSDGLTNHLRSEEILELILKQKDLDAAASELIAKALECGGSDNVTVVLLLME